MSPPRQKPHRSVQEQWWYVSMVSAEGRFIGGAIVRADNEDNAMNGEIVGGRLLSFAPIGTELLVLPIPPEELPHSSFRERILQKKDILQFWPDSMTIGEWRESGAEGK